MPFPGSHLLNGNRFVASMQGNRKLTLKAIPPVDGGAICKESLLQLVIDVYDCKANGKGNCETVARENAAKYLQKAIKLDASAFSSRKCKELLSIAGME